MGLVYRRTEAVVQRFSVKNIFLKISRNSHENICGKVSRASSGPATLFKKGFWHRYLPVSFEKFLKTSTP